jgi:hypothetical protein
MAGHSIEWAPPGWSLLERTLYGMHSDLLTIPLIEKLGLHRTGRIEEARASSPLCCERQNDPEGTMRGSWSRNIGRPIAGNLAITFPGNTLLLRTTLHQFQHLSVGLSQIIHITGDLFATDQFLKML